MNTFWMIYGQGCGRPTYQHMSFESAVAEAKRLARANPDINFVILKAIAAARKDDVRIETIQGAERDLDSEIPF